MSWYPAEGGDPVCRNTFDSCSHYLYSWYQDWPSERREDKALSDSYFCLIWVFQEALLYLLSSLKQPQAPAALESLFLFIGDFLGCSFLFCSCCVWFGSTLGDSWFPGVLLSFPVSSAFQMEVRCWGLWGSTVTQTWDRTDLVSGLGSPSRDQWVLWHRMEGREVGTFMFFGRSWKVGE